MEYCSLGRYWTRSAAQTEGISSNKIWGESHTTTLPDVLQSIAEYGYIMVQIYEGTERNAPR